MSRQFKLAVSLIITTLIGSVGIAAPVKVELKQADGGFQLLRDGKPFFVDGAGGGASKSFLKQCGANSFRTWGVGNDTPAMLEEANKLGLTVTLGLWLRHDKNFSYANTKAVEQQFENAKASVLKFKDDPALVIWDIGNEMEGYKDGGDPAVWAAVQALAAFIHKVDPNHPTMTTTAEIGAKRVESVNGCADIDIMGINSYGGLASLPERYRKVGGTKPYIITEFGPPGTWEIPKNSWGQGAELTSTAKGAFYRNSYEKAILAEKNKLCLGSYVFSWGAKQEASATWYGLFLADGTRLEAVDTMAELWTGNKPANRCPQIEPLKVEGNDKVNPGETVKVTLTVSDPENDSLKVKWVLSKDPQVESAEGDEQPVPPQYPEAIVSGDLKGCELKMPKDGQGYWLYAYVYDDKGGAAMANVPLFVNGPPPAPKAIVAEIPFALYEDGLDKLTYIWSGWIGKPEDIGMDEKNTSNPHSGATCMKCDFKSEKGFGGILWQSPANDWGDAPGGRDLTGATKLTFWARGEIGGEIVSFQCGGIGKNKKFHDSAKAELKKQELTADWKQYSIDLTNKDLSYIKTGFGWVVGGQGKPITFYLDDIRYEK